MDLEDLLKALSYYSVFHLGRDKIDQVYLENLLLEEFDLSCSSKKEINLEKVKKLKVPDFYVEELKNRGFSENKITKVFGLLTPSPSQVIKTFNELKKINHTKAQAKVNINERS